MNKKTAHKRMGYSGKRTHRRYVQKETIKQFPL